MAIEPCPSKTYEGPDFPIGWFSVARSRDLAVGEVKRVVCFDRELALFRTRSGQPVLLDAFCPHLGAHLGIEGRVVGETVRCPFHGWRFGADGQCVDIPYCDELPERASVRSWHVAEVNDEIMVWFHPEEAPPQWDVPVVEQLHHADWSEPSYWEFTIPNHVQNIAENTCDPVHFQYVHRQPHVPPQIIHIDDDGRVLRMEADASKAAYPSTLYADMHNPGLAIVRTVYGPDASMLVYSTAQPVSLHETHMRWTLIVTRSIVDFVGDEVMRGIKEGIGQDMPIWRHKVYHAKPVFCRGDTPLVNFRKWVRQFYLQPASRPQPEIRSIKAG